MSWVGTVCCIRTLDENVDYVHYVNYVHSVNYVDYVNYSDFILLI